MSVIDASPQFSGEQMLRGFPNPVFQSQETFRSVLSAMSRPGTIVSASTLEQPAPLDPATSAIALTLFDPDTPVWLDEDANSAAVRTWLAFHCGCPIVSAPSDAAFAIIADPKNAPGLKEFRCGHEEYPERAATLIYQVEGLRSGPAVTLSGPGIETEIETSVDGLPENFWGDWRVNYSKKPIGIDVVFVSGREMSALPRTSKMEG